MGRYTVGAVDLRLAVTVKVEPYPISLSGGHFGVILPHKQSPEPLGGIRQFYPGGLR